jgi:hypothetical protein
MTRKNINVSEIVHEKLSLQKRQEETFDDLLKREHDILPSSIDELTAFYPERLTTTAKWFVEQIEEQENFERVVVEYDEYYALEFDHPESGQTVVQVQFREELTEGMHALYRDHHGEMQTLVRAEMDENYLTPSDETNEEDGDLPVFVGPTINEEYEEWYALHEEHIVPRLQSKISGSYQRWG